MFRSRLLREQEGDQAQIQLAPLIDMMFILLIFFLVTTSFVNLSGVTVHRPSAKTASGLTPRSIYVVVDKEGRVYLEGSQVSLLSLRGRLRAKLRGGEAPVIVVPDSQTTAQALLTVLDECKLAGAKEVSVAAEPEAPAGHTPEGKA